MPCSADWGRVDGPGLPGTFGRRLVAVKTIRVELAEEAGFRTRFAQEVAAARKVSGVFTAAVVEADPEADLPWLATAYVLARRCPGWCWRAARCR